MFPAVPVSPDSRIQKAVEVRLKPGWRLHPRRRAFVSKAGKECVFGADLPRNTRIVPKVRSLVKTPEADLSAAEKELRQYVQVVLPEGESPASYLQVIQAWPCVAEAQLPPEVSLPSAGPSPVAPV
jgi:hypothetical protein